MDQVLVLDKGILNRNFIDISCSRDAVFVISREGKVYYWGHFAGKEQESPKHIPFDNPIVAVACGSEFVIAVDDTNSAFLFGPFVGKKNWEEVEKIADNVDQVFCGYGHFILRIRSESFKLQTMVLRYHNLFRV